jgi:chromosome segregation ATPase
MSTEQETKPKQEVSFINEKEYTKLQADFIRLQQLVSDVNDENTKLKSKLASYGDTTPEVVAELKRQALEKRTTEVAGSPEQISKLIDEAKEEVRKQLAAQIDQLQKERDAQSTRLKQINVTSRVMSEYGKGVTDDMRDMAEQIVTSSVDIDPANPDQFVVKDERGQVRYSKNNPAMKMTPAELFEELKQKRPSMFAAQGINQGSMTSGQRVAYRPGTNAVEGIDLERFKSDASYRESLGRDVRNRVYKQLGL